MEHTTPNAPEDRLLPFSDALKLVGISRSQVYLLQLRGEFPIPTKIGRCNYYSERELQAWINERLATRSSRSEKPASAQPRALRNECLDEVHYVDEEEA